MDKLKIGGYPDAYDPVEHGPYDPARFYGKPDTPFLDLKLKDIPAWLGRREKTPRAFMGACSRAFWRWQHKYIQPRKGGIAPFFQVTVGSMIFFYIINRKRISHHRNYKYH
ncbi:putative ATP synthase subunit f, mitochondrial [Harpegnathos saltator]|uniref:Putative ATP synthase subunit f, mitochondrial n=1 Tax=Harpegnathos saltator TaxID=610380 RepID=E2BIA6_HARSA|nr:putative ATP synthase subunit f, mitochondrial [Harpegnathos saltator]XP_019696957.1 putative ATP synthase subunit f, mitochondrial [Harpegnathos saltator]EFN84570.1 Putative ATP synthase subunit f, mitochondrial [Harpegnathos saltator]